MADDDLVWRWEQTPLEAWMGFTFWVPPPVKIPPEVSAFSACPRRPLPGTSLSYQLALSDKSLTRDVHLMREVHPELPISGDKRSGVLVLDGNRIVGGYIIEGSRYLQEWRITVDKDYRGQGIGSRMITEWIKRVKRARRLSHQKMNPNGVRTFLSAGNALYSWAVQQGKAVPAKVITEMETQAETNHILEVLAKVEKTGQAMKLEN